MSKVLVEKYSTLNFDIKKKINNEIFKEFENTPIVKKYEWAEPNWIIVKFVESEVASFAHLIERKVLIDNKITALGGVSNVVTTKRFQKKGYSKQVLEHTQSLIFEKLNLEYGLLFCNNSLVEFYKKLGWYLITSKVAFDQPFGKAVWSSSVMMLSNNQNIINPDFIDLCGLPW